MSKKNEYKNVMVDIETLDTNPGGVILSIGACRFGQDIDTKFYRNIDVFYALMEGFTVNQDTVNWWKEQGAEAKTVFKSHRMSTRQALEEFVNFLRPNDLIWAKGPDFDLVMLKTAYEKVGLKVPWFFRNARDVRTLMWLRKEDKILLPRADVYIKHFALHDAIYQAEIVMEILASMGLQQPGSKPPEEEGGMKYEELEREAQYLDKTKQVDMKELEDLFPRNLEANDGD